MDAVLNWLWQGCVVAVASFVMLRALERASANVRCVVCWAALLLIVVLPVLPLQPTAPSPEALSVTRGDAMVSLPDAWWTSSLMLKPTCLIGGAFASKGVAPRLCCRIR